MKRTILFLVFFIAIQGTLQWIHAYFRLPVRLNSWTCIIGLIGALFGLCYAVERFMIRRNNSPGAYFQCFLVSIISIVVMGYWALHFLGDGDMHYSPYMEPR